MAPAAQLALGRGSPRWSVAGQFDPRPRAELPAGGIIEGVGPPLSAKGASIELLNSMSTVHGLSSWLLEPLRIIGHCTLPLPGNATGVPGLPTEQVIGVYSWSSMLFKKTVFSIRKP